MSRVRQFLRRAVASAVSRALRLTHAQFEGGGGLSAFMDQSAERREEAVRQQVDRVLDARMRSVTERMNWIGSELERLDKRIDACERRLDLREHESGRGLDEVMRLDKRIDACEKRADISESDARWLRLTVIGLQNDRQIDLEQSKIAVQSLVRQVRSLEGRVVERPIGS